MSSLKDITDAWVDDITQNVAGLVSATVHRYAPWSLEELATSADERHLAVWPEGEVDNATPLLVTASHMLLRGFVILLWEDASEESTQRKDDETANAAWLDLYEAVLARIERTDNLQTGGSEVMTTDFVGGAFPRVTGKRVMELRIRVSVPRQFA